MSNLKKEYIEQIVPKLLKEFEYQNLHQIPKLEKIQISSGLGLNAQNRTFLQKAIEEFRLISGQQPILTKAKNSIAGFKIREGMPLGLVVTLFVMYTFNAAQPALLYLVPACLGGSLAVGLARSELSVLFEYNESIEKFNFE